VSVDLGFLPDAEEGQQSLIAPVGWSVPTEQDNMNQHEWPICQETGLALRSNYGDIKLASVAAGAQLDTLMKRMAEEEAKALAEAKEKSQAAYNQATKSVCAIYGTEFPSQGKLSKHLLELKFDKKHKAPA
jgi:hypothetical protein